MTLSTVAPYSARIREIVGPAMMRHSSRTLMPSRTRGLDNVGAGKGTGGEVFSSGDTVHAGSFAAAAPFKKC